MAENLSYNPYRDMHNDVQFSAMFFGKNIQNIPVFSSTQTAVKEFDSYGLKVFTFTGKERDSETGYSYFGARYYDSDILTGWLSVDPLADKYPSLSPYAYCAWNPVKLVDPDGEDPFTAILEGVTAFGISAGVDFIENFIFEGMSAKDAVSSINWGSATLDAVTTAGLSFFVSGTGSTKMMAKIAKSKGGKMVTEMVQSMVTSVFENFETGEYNSIDDINWEREFYTATILTLVNNGLNSRADDLIAGIEKNNTVLASRLTKQKRNIEAQKNSVRLKRDDNQVKISRKNRNSAIREYQINQIKYKGSSELLENLDNNE